MSLPAPRTLRILAPGKLNLGLRVTGRREDGYHLLESLFVPFDLSDEIRVGVSSGAPRSVVLRIVGGPRGLAADATNLAARAAAAFLDAAGLDAAVHIELIKRIPMGAGLGGGSSDAAAVLRALGECLPGVLDASRLAGLALALGADVPFFLAARPALVRGIGEQIEPITRVPALSVLVATPAPALPTVEVFRAYDEALALTPGEVGRTMPPLLALLEESWPVGPAGPPGSLQTLLANDLEPVATRLRPAVGRLRREIEQTGARAVGMSGSGPTVFGVFGDAGEAQAAAAKIRWEPSDRVHVGRTASSP